MAHATFKEMMNEVVDFGSCCECGTCVLVCPHNVIDYVDGKPKQVAKATAAFDHCGISEGIGCDVCAQVCPRLGIREFDLRDRVIPREPGVYEGVFGRYRRIVAARAKDPEVLARCQDGGVVTTMLCHGLREGRFDGAVVSAADESMPAAPKPKVVTTVAEAIASASSWYTYCPNNLALADAERLGLKKVCFVGVPCQITPTRKIQAADPSFLVNGRKKEKHIERQTKFLKGFGEIVEMTIGLLCTEVFTYEGLMVQKIQEEMGVPLTDVKKFNVKGKVLIYKKDGAVVEMPLHRAQEYARVECHHCGDFTAELADVSCGGVACMDWTITILRTAKGEAFFDDLVARGLVETKSMDEFESSMKVMLRLTKKQRERVPVPPGRAPRYVRPEGYPPVPADPTA
ncbi:MAG TPA: Coenzyme F420 hydrogenase/dehydrogenase, beta subunit C-terminal domain [Candidatus Binatia bacterium]|jgi:coenzyme F420 hydrogenase subunit beta|nr:Coenzyme F420 hydrogenase/dehydrogenase, beta subunit C-terminal domain [Candidatus Binatia bacterium]